MKKAGITADDYKLDKFKEKLDAKGLTYEVFPFTEGTSVIKVDLQNMSDAKVIHGICIEVELHFKHQN